MISIFQALAELEKNNQLAALCTVIKSEGSTPRHVGSKMLVYPDGKFIGTVGGGDLEHRVLDEARMAMSDGNSRYLQYSMADPSRGDPGVCGGQVEVFVEPILPPPNSRRHWRRTCWESSCPSRKMAGLPRRRQ